MAETDSRVLKKVIIHTDGGCQGNPGPGGWGVVLRYGEHTKAMSGAVPATTNNRMEMQAAISALAILKERCEVTIHTDSEYLRNGITQWLKGWKARGWRTADRQPVKNVDLWKELDVLAARHRIEWRWLKGHAGHSDNEQCDGLATAAIEALRRQYTRRQLRELRDAFVAGT